MILEGGLMERIIYSKEKMDIVRSKIQQMIGIVADLEEESKKMKKQSFILSPLLCW